MADHDFKKFPELSNKQMEQFGFQSPHKQIKEDFQATVVRVHDGDTITLETDFRDFKFPLRFLDIDSKELGEGGEEAAEYVKRRLEGENVEIRINNKNRVDKYGRLLGHVFHSGSNVGNDELRLGLAVEFGRRQEAQLPNLTKELNMKKWLST